MKNKIKNLLHKLNKKYFVLKTWLQHSLIAILTSVLIADHLNDPCVIGVIIRICLLVLPSFIVLQVVYNDISKRDK